MPQKRQESLSDLYFTCMRLKELIDKYFEHHALINAAVDIITNQTTQILTSEQRLDKTIYFLYLYTEQVESLENQINSEFEDLAILMKELR